MSNNNNIQSIENTIKNVIYGHGRGWCFSPNDFTLPNHKEAIYKTLQRFANSGFIRRIAHGIYDYPKQHPKLGVLPPNYEEVAKALARKHGIKIQPSGSYAANILGYTEQVPAQIIFLTDGPKKKIQVGNTEIIFQHTTIKNMSLAGTKMGLIVQGLKNIGQKFLSDKIKKKLAAHLSTIDSKEFKKALKVMPAWMKDLTMELKGNDL